MAYSVDTRKLVLSYLQNGHTYVQTKRDLGVSELAIRSWEKKLRETGSLENKELHRKPRKLDNDELKAYISEHPDAYYTEIAAHFGCSDEGVRKACKRLGITRKKRQKLTRSATKKSVKHTSK